MRYISALRKVQEKSMPVIEETVLICCFSCHELHCDDELGECLRCGERFCDMSSSCKGRCACDGQKVRDELVMEIDTLLQALEEERSV